MPCRAPRPVLGSPRLVQRDAVRGGRPRQEQEKVTAVVEERTRSLDLAIGQIEKQFGKGAIMRLGDQKSLEIEAIPTGSLALDLALGIGGVPRGRITEIYGPE